MSSWGGAAVGRVRPSETFPTISALCGLVGACLGIARKDEEQLLALADGYTFAFVVRKSGVPLRDFHTIESISARDMRSRVIRTRRDEIEAVRDAIRAGKDYKSMVPTTREYQMDVDFQVFIYGAAPYSLEQLAGALAYPVWIPYLGRKSCPLAAPMAPEIVQGEFAVDVMTEPDAQVFWQQGFPAGLEPAMSVQRNDKLLSRRFWEYDRQPILSNSAQ